MSLSFVVKVTWNRFVQNRASSLRIILELLISHVKALVNCDESSIVLYNSASEHFEIGASTDQAQVERRVRRTGGATRWIIDHGERLIVPDIEGDPFNPNPILVENGIRSYMGVPIAYGDMVEGVLYALYHSYHTPSDSELNLMEAAAALAGMTLVQTRMIDSLQDYNELNDTVMSLAVHDLKNPLNSLRGFYDLLLGDLPPLSPKHAEWSSFIHRCLDQIVELVESILSYKRVTAFGQLEQEPVELNMLVQAVAEENQPAVFAQTHDLIINTAPEPMLFLGDQFLLKQAVGNLVGNAIKYCPPGSTIILEAQRIAGRYVIAVKDNGPGLTVHQQAQLFQPFVRLDPDESGSGLGLSLVKRIVEKHDGRVSVQSAPGAGTTCYVQLPARLEMADPHEQFPVSSPLAAPTILRGSPRVRFQRGSSLQDTLNHIAYKASDLDHASGGASVILWSPRAEAYYLAATTLPGQTPQTPLSRIRRQAGATRWIIENHEALAVSNIDNDPFGANPLLRETGNHAYVGLPLHTAESVLGVLYLLSRQPHVVTWNELNRLQQIAHKATEAIIEAMVNESQTRWQQTVASNLD